MDQTVVLAGATGMLGGRIAHHLLHHGGVELRLLVRPGTGDSGEKSAQLRSFVAAGARLVTGDLHDPAGLARAVEGADVVLSAVQGGRAVIVDGQVALAGAARRAGVRRFLPSDYALDFFKSVPGELPSFDLRREAAERIGELGIEQVHVLNGAFLDLFVGPRGALEIDDERGTATFWGTGTEKFDATGVDDTARYAALAALDHDLPAGKFAVAAEQISLGDVLDVIEQTGGRGYRRVSRGTIDDLRDVTARARAADAASMEAIMNGYQVAMLSGRTALDDLRNDRYPEVRPRTLRQLIEAAGSTPAGVAA